MLFPFYQLFKGQSGNAFVKQLAIAKDTKMKSLR